MCVQAEKLGLGKETDILLFSFKVISCWYPFVVFSYHSTVRINFICTSYIEQKNQILRSMKLAVTKVCSFINSLEYYVAVLHCYQQTFCPMIFLSFGYFLSFFLFFYTSICLFLFCFPSCFPFFFSGRKMISFCLLY